MTSSVYILENVSYVRIQKKKKCNKSFPTADPGFDFSDEKLKEFISVKAPLHKKYSLSKVTDFDKPEENAFNDEFKLCNPGLHVIKDLEETVNLKRL